MSRRCRRAQLVCICRQTGRVKPVPRCGETPFPSRHFHSFRSSSFHLSPSRVASSRVWTFVVGAELADAVTTAPDDLGARRDRACNQQPTFLTHRVHSHGVTVRLIAVNSLSLASLRGRLIEYQLRLATVRAGMSALPGGR